MKRLLYALLLVGLVSRSWANEADDFVAQAKDLLEKGDAAEALSKCDIGTAYGATPELYFVRGVAAANLGQYSRALLDIGRAKRAGFKTKRCDALIAQIEAKRGKKDADGAKPGPSKRAAKDSAGSLSMERRAEINKSTDGALLLKMIEAMDPKMLKACGIHKLTAREFIAISGVCRYVSEASSEDGFRKGVKAASEGTVTVEQVQKKVQEEEDAAAASEALAKKAASLADRIEKEQALKPSKTISPALQEEYKQLVAEDILGPARPALKEAPAASTLTTPYQRKHSVYVYKQLDPGGLLCVFYSDYLELAERNARDYVELEREKYGHKLTATQALIE